MNSINWEFIETHNEQALPQEEIKAVREFLLKEEFKEEWYTQDAIDYYGFDYQIEIGFNEIGILFINKEKKLFFIRWY